jgi:hypothetical protein
MTRSDGEHARDSGKPRRAAGPPPKDPQKVKVISTSNSGWVDTAASINATLTFQPDLTVIIDITTALDSTATGVTVTWNGTDLVSNVSPNDPVLQAMVGRYSTGSTTNTLVVKLFYSASPTVRYQASNIATTGGTTTLPRDT